MDENTMTDTSSAPASTSSSNVVFVGSLAWATDESSLRRKFEEAGFQIAEDEVKDDGYVKKAVVVVMDRETGRSKGYGFVTLTSPEQASEAAEKLNDTELDGRNIRVQPKEDRPRSDRPRRSFGNGGRRYDNNRGAY
jgi:RNA recognition motif-containing protein